MTDLSQPSLDERRAGFIAATGAYLIWGFLPVYLKLVGYADPREILGMRILWSVPAALATVALTGGFAQLRPALQPRMLMTLAGSAVFIFGNWAIYVWAVATERVMEAALAYFLAPLVNVAMGVALFSEKLSRAQFAALAFAAAGVVLQGVAMGGAPIASIALCATWCCYALVRKQAPVSSSAGLFVETVWLIPAAMGMLFWAAHTARLAFDDTAGQALMLALSGPLTAIPLMLFAFGARRLTFSALGLLQYLAPSIQFLLGLAYGEPMTALRGVSFALIWAGLVLFSWDAIRKERAR
jgi:chloramphenicol-sensitive protein RarD